MDSDQPKTKMIQVNTIYQPAVTNQVDPKLIQRNKQIRKLIQEGKISSLIGIVLKNEIAINWNVQAFADNKIPYQLVRLDPNSEEYEYIGNAVKSTQKFTYTLVKIERIENVHLLGKYLLKREELQNISDSMYEEVTMYHGTHHSAVKSISENNFNWRQTGSNVRGTTAGRGVYFATTVQNAAYYTDLNDRLQIVIQTRVLMNNCCVGDETMFTPPIGYDTTHSDNKMEFVKYDDNEFYPEFAIYFEKRKRNTT